MEKGEGEKTKFVLPGAPDQSGISLAAANQKRHLIKARQISALNMDGSACHSQGSFFEGLSQCGMRVGGTGNVFTARAKRYGYSRLRD
jgi:hypothetical protein